MKMGLFERKQTFEMSRQQSLVDQYAIAYQQMGMPAFESRKQAEEFVQAGVTEVEARGWHNQPPGYGDILLREEPNNKDLATSLNNRRQDGVTDDDIRWWWNMSPLDRVLIEKADEQNRMAAILTCLKQGMEAADAAQAAFKANPKYGESSDSNDPDRPIPIELKRRITEWSERQQRNIEVFRAKIEEATSFNALVRDEIAKRLL